MKNKKNLIVNVSLLDTVNWRQQTNGIGRNRS